MPKATLSVAIITLNEEANLARTLASVGFANEVIVVDSGSTDRTLEIAESFGAKIFTEPWKGFARQKNSAIEKCVGTWVLSLDADEELTAELQREIGQMLEGDAEVRPPVDGYRLRLRHVFLGRWMRHGGYYPDLKLRLFRRVASAGAAGFTERPVHESVQVAGRVEMMKNDFLHHGYPELNIYLEHMNRYSSLGGKIVAAKGKVSRSWVAFCWNVVWVPLLTFVWNFGFRLGFLDGREGLLLHLYHSAYISWKYAKAWQIGRYVGSR
ncbi:glycosyltransferase family 2 protein [Tunturiibacter empetritectus]|uniref:Glycosyltransferase involved in cell wall biosynthesis n=2 Tax=Tunturiibacter TaxID=3154218 RepID=A0A852VH40_9BACT|nr:glycosyltransferase family 2 protein [Edaphobacter lichenicola]NYF90369.1 glycosyltransferase involved in cell wall biosynthesis [Edaphobacter lichenicola]